MQRTIHTRQEVKLKILFEQGSPIHFKLGFIGYTQWEAYHTCLKILWGSFIKYTQVFLQDA